MYVICVSEDFSFHVFLLLTKQLKESISLYVGWDSAAPVTANGKPPPPLSTVFKYIQYIHIVYIIYPSPPHYLHLSSHPSLHLILTSNTVYHIILLYTLPIPTK